MYTLFLVNKLTLFTHFIRQMTSGYRIVTDSFGSINVPSDRLYGAQTERSRRNFDICSNQDKMPVLSCYIISSKHLNKLCLSVLCIVLFWIVRIITDSKKYQ